MKIVTLTRLNRALAAVIRDFEHFGIWNDRLYSVDVFLVPIGSAWGWKYNGASGNIHIPAVSLCRIRALLGTDEHWGLRDVLRHEYGHAVADLYPRQLSYRRQFIQSFGASYHHEGAVSDYAPELHMTAYCATKPAEDFCETLMFYLKHRGRLPRRFKTPVIRMKWQFVQRFITRIRENH